MAKCMQCGGAKKMASTDVGKASSMAKRKMAKGGSTTNKLNNARGFAKAQTGGSNTKMMIFGVPNAGMTGPNRNSQTETMKKGGAKKTTTKKPLMKKGGSVKKPLTKAQAGRAMTSGPFDKATTDYLNTRYPGTSVRVPYDPEYYAQPQSQSDYTSMSELEADDRRNTEARMRSANNREDFNAGSMEGYRRGGAKKAMMKKGGAIKKKMAKGGSTFGMLSVKAGIDKNPNPTAADRIAGAKMKKAKFGASVNVQRSPKAGKIRSASAQGYAAIGKREPGRIIKKTIGKKK